MPTFSFNELLNVPTDLDDAATRPSSGANFRALTAAGSDSDDTERTIPAASIAPGDHMLPIPNVCTTPVKLLHWMLERFYQEQQLIGSNFVVTQRTRSTANNGDTVRNTYSIRVDLDMSAEVIDPLQVTEPNISYPA